MRARSDKTTIDELLSHRADMGYKSHAVNGMAATGAAQGVKLVIQFASVIILARLLIPEYFGIFAMVTPVMGLVAVIQDFGLAQALITARSIDLRQLSTIFWVNMAFTACLALIVVAIAPLVGWFYGESEVVWLTIAFAINMVFACITSPHYALMARGMRFGTLAMIDTAAALAGFLSALAVAWIFPSPWAMFAAAVGSSLVSVTSAALVVRWRPGRPGRLSDIRELLHFGTGLTGFNLTNFVARNFDNVLIGRFAGPTPLGYYDRAYKLLLFPLSQITAPVSRVMVPLLSRLRDDPERYRSAYLRTVQQILLVTVPGVIFLLVDAESVFVTLLGPEWAPAVPIFMWLGLAALIQPMSSSQGWLFMSQGRMGEFARWGVFSGLSCVIAFAIGLQVRGVVGLAAAYALSDIFLRVPVLWWWVGRTGPVSTRDLYATAFPHAVAGAITAGVLLATMHYLPGRTVPWLIFYLALAYLANCAAIMSFASGRKTLIASVEIVLGLLRRKKAPLPEAGTA